MLIHVPPPTTRDLSRLKRLRDDARTHFFQHNNPGGLTPAQLDAWMLEHNALELLLRAAQARYDAEVELRQLMQATA